MKLCLDTNAYSELMKGNQSLVSILENADEIYVPSIVLGELYSGFQIGNLLEKNMSILDEFLSRPGIFVLSVNQDVSFRYGFLVKELRKKGTPIPTNDIWIAATSIDSGAILLSRDSHFLKIAGLQVLDF